jgi:hypothetical protein
MCAQDNGIQEQIIVLWQAQAPLLRIVPLWRRPMEALELELEAQVTAVHGSAI